MRDHFGGPNGPLSDWDNNTYCCYYNFLECSSSSSAYGRVFAVEFNSLGLNGTIPSDFGDLPYLDYFIIANNPGVTGPIPKAFGKLKKLYHFGVGSNSLTGPIPKEILQSKTLQEVNLSNNKLSGPIPLIVSSLYKLTQFNVSNNQLCGSIPSGLTKFGNTSFDHNKCLCGSPLAPCNK